MLLQPAAEFVRWAEGEDYISTSLVPVMLARCIDKLTIVIQTDSRAVRGMKTALLDSILSRLGSILQVPNLCLAAAALHPAYGHLKFVDQMVRDDMWKELAQWCVEFPASQSSSSERLSCRPRRPAHISKFRQILLSYARPSRVLQTRHPQLLIFATSTPSKFGRIWSQVDRKNSHAFRILDLARMVLAIPATCAPSEREFSAANLIVTQLRAGLSPQKVCAMTMLRQHANTVPMQEFLDFCVSELFNKLKFMVAGNRPTGKQKIAREGNTFFSSAHQPPYRQRLIIIKEIILCHCCQPNRRKSESSLFA